MKRYQKKFNEKSPKIVKDVLYGIHKYAKTFGIMIAENPMGEKIASSKNKEHNKEFHSLLSRGRYQFVKIKGSYGNMENPALIINIPLKELKYYGDQYVQESVIFGKINDYRDVSFKYWDRNNATSPLKKKDSINHIDVLKDPKDFYSAIKNWKFNIPFPVFEQALIYWYQNKIEHLSENSKQELIECVDKIVESDEKYTGTHFFKLRGHFNYIINKGNKNEKV